MLKTIDYAKQIIEYIENKMENVDVFTVNINKVSIPYSLWVRVTKIVNDYFGRFDAPYNFYPVDSSWVFWKNKGAIYAQREIEKLRRI